MEYVQRNSLRGSRRNIRQHYDLNTDFYQLWLDPQLVYTCCLLCVPVPTLEQAQVAKLDYVCPQGATPARGACRGSGLRLGRFGPATWPKTME